ncbi:MAG: DEAD/DEAH box helicase family protein [Roseburia sp.]|nr:DEAD/DEAH box helicase family protein [Roseburia sp.]
MNFKDLLIKKSYINQGTNNFVDCLLNPALKLAKTYRRSVGFFSSSVFKLIINALPSFIRNDGKISLIVSPTLSEDDITAIQLGYERKEDLINRRFFEDFNGEIKYFDDTSLEVLSELVARGILDIKVASVKNNVGIYHDKLGILVDKDDNKIVFYGSPNSSINAYQNNYERVRVVRSWVAGEGDSVGDEVIEFDRLWDNQNEFLEVYDFMDSIKKRIFNVIEERKFIKKNSEPIKLFDYQEQAINKWVENGHKGFYIMATGTGKTWTAIYSAKKLIEDYPSLIVIAAPYKHLVKQWAEDVKKAFKDATIVLISSENHSWYTDAKRAVIAQKYEQDKQIILITTIKSFYSDKFEAVMDLSSQDKLLIVDEAHRFTQRDDELHTTFKYMLGLSATPINGKNNAAGIELVNFFGGQVFNLPIEDALERHFLVPYNYHPIFVPATEDEENRFNQISANMASCFHEGVLVDTERFVKYVRSRLRVISMAENKISHIDDFIKQIPEKDHFIVYCGDGRLFDGQRDDEIRHIQFVKDRLYNLGIKSSQFTATESMDRRMELVDMFNNNEISSLVAIRCLDEGINIPSIKSALILSSNDDYREFVQRRGRILRKYGDKKCADIYDVIVLPTELTPKMAIIELRRYYEYARLALNHTELLEQLDTMLGNYNLTLEDVMFYTEINTEVDLDD